ncbi:MAG TPA: cobalamin-binding protein [Alphaproteobacteria bacterium]|jgi:iron complex transport system substrate-binding protein
MADPRIVSLIPSATEIVAALGFADRMVGRSHECDFPDGVEALPPLTEPKAKLEGSSAEVDRRVRDLIERGLAVYKVDAERLRQLDPDLIVTQDQCQICAASLADVEAATRGWTGRKVRIVSLNPMSLDDVWRDIGKLAQALGVAAEGARLIAGLKSRMQAIAVRAQRTGSRPRVALVEWIEPLMSGGNWMPTLVGMAGGENLFGTAGAHSPWLEWEALKSADPDAILVAPCGLGLDRIRAEMPVLAARPGWRNLAAVKAKRVFLADGHQFFNRPGPRLAESLEILAEILHPDLFDFGHRGRAWEAAR